VAGQANAHEESGILQMNLIYRSDRRSFCCVLFVNSKGAVFFVYILWWHLRTTDDEKEGAGKIINADIRRKQVEEIINQENKLQLSSMQMIRIV